jgi:hypothetical protein
MNNHGELDEELHHIIPFLENLTVPCNTCGRERKVEFKNQGKAEVC